MRARWLPKSRTAKLYLAAATFFSACTFNFFVNRAKLHREYQLAENALEAGGEALASTHFQRSFDAYWWCNMSLLGSVATVLLVLFVLIFGRRSKR
jgi:hypothetical protein